MRILIVGAGIVGMTTAWQLYQDGHDVIVVDAEKNVACGTSFANGGQITLAESAPWASPHTLYQMLRGMLRSTSPFQLRLQADYSQWKWLFSFLKNCRMRPFSDGVKRNLKLAFYSQSILQKTRDTLGNDLSYDDEQAGIVHLISHRSSHDQVALLEGQLKKYGIASFRWDKEQLVKNIPYLSHAVNHQIITSGLWTPDGETGDTRLFTEKMFQYLSRKGIIFHFNCHVQDFMRQGQKLTAIITNHGDISVEGLVLATGIVNPHLSYKLGIKLPILPIKGYSITVPIKDMTQSSPISLTDIADRIVVSRLGKRMRIAGYADIGKGNIWNEYRIDALKKRLESLCPHFVDYEQTEKWYGLRPMTPDGSPVIGCINGFNNVWLNIGHGSLGWTFSHGTARLIADVIKGQTPKLDITPFHVHRRYG